jgi:hypothetical protein
MSLPNSTAIVNDPHSRIKIAIIFRILSSGSFLGMTALRDGEATATLASLGEKPNPFN